MSLYTYMQTLQSVQYRDRSIYYDGINMCVPCTGTCEEPHKVCITLCTRGCGCPVGTVLDEETKACVNVTDCPKEGVSPVTIT